MPAYTAIAAAEIDVDKPITESIITRVRNNPIAITEGATGAPKFQTDAYQALSVTHPKLRAREAPPVLITNYRFKTYIIPHGFATRPWRIDVWFVCLSAEHGYSVGDYVQASFQISKPQFLENYGMTALADNTNVYLKLALQGLGIIHKTAYTGHLISNNAWEARLKAWGV